MLAEFAKAFGPGPITMGKIEKALASFDVRRSAAIPSSIDITMVATRLRSVRLRFVG